MPRIGLFTGGSNRAAKTNGAPRPTHAPRKLTKRPPAPKSVPYDSVSSPSDAREVTSSSSFKAKVSRAFNDLREDVCRPAISRQLYPRLSAARTDVVREHPIPLRITDIFELLSDMQPKLAGNRALQAKLTDDDIAVCTEGAAYAVARRNGLAYPPLGLEARDISLTTPLAAPGSAAPMRLHSRTPPLPPRNPRRKTAVASKLVSDFAHELDRVFNPPHDPWQPRRPSPTSRAVPILEPRVREPTVRCASVKIVAPTPRPLRVSQVLPRSNTAQYAASQLPKLTYGDPRHGVSPSLSVRGPYLEMPYTATPFAVSTW